MEASYWADLSNSGCNQGASLTVNIVGTGDVNFNKISNSLLWTADQTLLSNKPAEDNQNKLLWNVIGDRRAINAGTTAPAGVLLAPHVF